MSHTIAKSITFKNDKIILIGKPNNVFPVEYEKVEFKATIDYLLRELEGGMIQLSKSVTNSKWIYSLQKVREELKKDKKDCMFIYKEFDSNLSKATKDAEKYVTIFKDSLSQFSNLKNKLCTVYDTISNVYYCERVGHKSYHVTKDKTSAYRRKFNDAVVFTLLNSRYKIEFD